MLEGSADFLKILCGPDCAVPGTTLIKSVATDAMSDSRPSWALNFSSENRTALSGASRGWPRPRKGRSRGSSIAEPLLIACAPPTITIVETAEAAAEMTAMETMTSTPVAAAKAVTTAAKAAPVTTPAHAAPTVAATAHAATAVAATAATAHQDQRTARCTRTQLLGVGIARQSRQCSGGGNSQRKSANKTRRDKTAFHDCVPFVGYVGIKLLTECMATPLGGPASMRRVR
jgi:hypothetical protein